MRNKMLNFVVMLLLITSLPMLAGNPKLPYRGEGHMMINGGNLDWQPIASMAPGAKIAILEGDLSKAEPFTFRLKMPANYRVAPHIHPAYERVTVLKGTFYFAHGRTYDRDKAMPLPVGGFAVMAPGDPMYGYTTEETIIQLHGTGPWGIEYLDPADDPRLN
jgi:hypothetical protein